MIRPSCNMTHNMDPGFRSMNRYIVRNNGTHAAYTMLPMSNSVHPAYGPISPGLKDAHRVDRYPQPVKPMTGTLTKPEIGGWDPEIGVLDPKSPKSTHFWTPKIGVLGPKSVEKRL